MHLLTECTEHLVLAHSDICRQAQARAPVRMQLVRAYVMSYHTVTFKTRTWQFAISIQIGQLNTLQVLVVAHSAQCKVYCVLQCTELQYKDLSLWCQMCNVSVTAPS